MLGWRRAAARQAHAYRLAHAYRHATRRAHIQPAGPPQIHLGMTTVGSDRVGSALKHLLKGGAPVLGLASVFTAVVANESALASAAQKGHAHVCIEATSLADAVAAVTAAKRAELVPRVLLPPMLCMDPRGTMRELNRAGAEVIMMSVDATASAAEVSEMVETACGDDDEAVALRARLGLCVGAKPAPDALQLVEHAYTTLGLLHFYACLGGVHAPQPTALLKACGVRPADFASGPLMLAEFVPDAA